MPQPYFQCATLSKLSTVLHKSVAFLMHRDALALQGKALTLYRDALALQRDTLTLYRDALALEGIAKFSLLRINEMLY